MSRKLSGELIIDLKRELDPNAKKPAARMFLLKWEQFTSNWR
jgi:hypothetical protein